MKTDLAGKVVVVTGASGAIGAAIAIQFAGEGAKVVLHYRRNRGNAEALQRKLKRSDSIIVRADLTKEAEVKRLFAQTLERFARVDTLVANAGSWETRDVPLDKMSLRQWRQTLDNVLTSAFLSTREFFKIVARQKRGNALLIASTAGVFGEAGHSDYASAKSAMAFGLTRSLKNEIARLAPHTLTYCGGRVNCICPGWTIVPRTADRLQNTEVVRKVTSTMALPKLARTEDIASAAVFLSSDALAGHITGQTLVIAGGMEGRLLWPPHDES
ncbi:MAG TPA: SDR family oxidoreductase [Terriglobia bacterium]|nr:SDR family oxidoreductase [Terriglobia bacterium]